MLFELKSPAFQNSQEIPTEYTGEGEDISPPLEWSGVPKGTKEFVMICEDPDAPTTTPFIHWLIYNLSPTVTSLHEGFVPLKRVEAPVRADQGTNSFGNIGYGGPMPPIAHGIHHYIFKLYALNTEMGLAPGATKETLMKSMQGHILDAAQLVGKYERRSDQKAAG
jgi:Raf kinase inhibitor-like YbhB/YbcL family protein